MNTPQLFFSLVFFVAFAAYFLLGHYILCLNPRAVTNRVFFALCLALSWWAFSFSIAISAPTYESALIWRRISAWGWGSVYSILLHFVIVLTEQGKRMSSMWLALLYTPALINVITFGLLKQSEGLYHLVQTPVGWTTVSSSTGWDWHFYAYYIGFTMVSVVLLWRWGKRAFQHNIKRQANLMIYSFPVALILGTLTDIVGNAFFSVKLPQLGPIIVLLPISAMFYAIKRFGMISEVAPNEPAERGRILNDAGRAQVYTYLSLAFIFLSFIRFIALYFIGQQNIYSSLLYCGTLLAIGLAISFVGRLSMKNSAKDYITAGLMALSFPLIALGFVESAGTSVWAAPFIIVVLSVVFSRSYMVIMLAMAILLTQIVVWIRMSYYGTHVDSADYFSRILIYGVALWVASYVNRVYRARLLENENQIKFQELISRISADFVSASADSLECKIKDMLKATGEHFQVDRVCLCTISSDQRTVKFDFQWCGEGI